MSFGSAIGAIVSLKNNRRHKDSKLEKYKATTGAPIKGVTSHRTPNEEELTQLRNKLLAERKKRQLKVFIILAAFLLLFSGAFFYLMF